MALGATVAAMAAIVLVIALAAGPCTGRAAAGVAPAAPDIAVLEWQALDPVGAGRPLP